MLVVRRFANEQQCLHMQASFGDASLLEGEKHGK
jgi:hypothetical protein